MSTPAGSTSSTMSLNSGAGTIRGRAVVPNPDGFLKAGHDGPFAPRLPGALSRALVPDTAIVTDARAPGRLCCGPQRANAVRPVQLGPLNGNLRVIRSGIGPQDQVIIGGIQRAMPGPKVKPKKGRIQPPTTTEPERRAPQAPPPSVATSVDQAGGR